MFEKQFEGLKVIVDQSKDDCNREPAHCHATKSGRRVAQVMVEPYVYAKHSDLNDEQTKRLEEFVRGYATAIADEYRRNARG